LRECMFDRCDDLGPAGWITCVLHFDNDGHDGLIVSGCGSIQSKQIA
jgi:hypothetical protein